MVSKAASRFLQSSAAGGPGGGGGKGAAPRSNSTSAKALRRRTRSFQAGSFEYGRSPVPSDNVIF